MPLLYRVRAPAMPPMPNELALVKNNTHLPVLIGSGTRPDTLPQLQQADAYIVGSYLKYGGKVTNDIDEHRLKEMKTLISEEHDLL